MIDLRKCVKISFVSVGYFLDRPLIAVDDNWCFWFADDLRISGDC